MSQAVSRIEHPKPPVQAGSDSVVLLQLLERGATDPSVDMDKMERLYAMYERTTDRQAASAFTAAMVRAQRAMKPVVRDAVNTHTNSRYARLEAIDKEISPIYTEHGFSLSFGTQQCPLPGHIRMICDVMHEAGHIRQYQTDLPLDAAGSRGNTNKTGVQAHGSTFSYGRRYMTVMIFNIAIVDEDNDGNTHQGDSEPADDRQPSSPQASQKPQQQPATTDTGHFDQARFEQNLPAYRAMIERGEKTSDHIITMLSMKAQLTEQQKAVLRSISANQ